MYRGFGVPPSQSLESLKELQDFKFPSPPEKMQGVIDGIDAVVPIKNINVDVGGIVNPPVANLITGVQTTFESATNLKFNQLVRMADNIYSLTQAANPAQIFMAVNQLLTGTLDIAASLSKDVATAVESFQSIPFFGTIMDTMLGFISDVLSSQARYSQHAAACQQRADQHLDRFCSELSRISTPRPTGPSGQTPADMFRPLAVRYQKGSRQYPANVSTIYLLLCGEETQGFGFPRGHRFPQGTKIQIPRDTQRRMWRLIRGLMKQAKNPSITASFAELSDGDDGYSLMPILQDIVYNEWMAGRISRPMLNYLSDYGLYWTDYYVECPDLSKGEIGAGAMPAGAGSCRDRLNLASTFEQSIQKYKNQLRAYYWDPSKNTWKNPRGANFIQVGNVAKVPGARGILTLSKEAIQQIEETQRAQHLGLPGLSADERKAAIATTAVVLGGGSFLMARRVAKR